MYRSNVEGTRNLLSGRAKCGRGTGGLYQHRGLHRNSEGRNRDEEAPVSGRYGRADKRRILAEQVALEFAGEGFRW